jgi:hypothetical protein
VIRGRGSESEIERSNEREREKERERKRESLLGTTPQQGVQGGEVPSRIPELYSTNLLLNSVMEMR